MEMHIKVGVQAATVSSQSINLRFVNYIGLNAGDRMVNGIETRVLMGQTYANRDTLQAQRVFHSAHRGLGTLPRNADRQTEF